MHYSLILALLGMSDLVRGGHLRVVGEVPLHMIGMALVVLMMGVGHFVLVLLLVGYGILLPV